MKVTKGSAFWAGLIALLLIYAGTLALAPSAAEAVGAAIVFAVVGLVTAFSGANVADNYQRARWFREELNEKERKG